jgi:hypothetical protein
VEDALSMSKNVMPTLVDVSGGVWNQVGCVLDGCCVTYELSTTSQHPSLTRMTEGCLSARPSKELSSKNGDTVKSSPAHKSLAGAVCSTE